jgi:hypothetical protein
MSSEPSPTPAAASATGLTLETEPLVFFHPTLAGLAPPGKVQPLPGPVPLEEEPATWAELRG